MSNSNGPVVIDPTSTLQPEINLDGSFKPKAIVGQQGNIPKNYSDVSLRIVTVDRSQSQTAYTSDFLSAVKFKNVGTSINYSQEELAAFKDKIEGRIEKAKMEEKELKLAPVRKSKEKEIELSERFKPSEESNTFIDRFVSELARLWYKIMVFLENLLKKIFGDKKTTPAKNTPDLYKEKLKKEKLEKEELEKKNEAEIRSKRDNI